MLTIQPYQQKTSYTCSAASLLAVLRYWNLLVDEPTLTRLIGAKPKVGATPAQVVRAAQRLGFSAEVKQFRSIDELRVWTDRGIPIILNVLSFYRPGQGHFVVAADVDDRYVTVMDPNAPTNWRRLPRAELDRRWCGRARTGVVVVPST